MIAIVIAIVIAVVIAVMVIVVFLVMMPVSAGQTIDCIELADGDTREPVVADIAYAKGPTVRGEVAAWQKAWTFLFFVSFSALRSLGFFLSN